MPLVHKVSKTDFDDMGRLTKEAHQRISNAKPESYYGLNFNDDTMYMSRLDLYNCDNLDSLENLPSGLSALYLNDTKVKILNLRDFPLEELSLARSTITRIKLPLSLKKLVLSQTGIENLDYNFVAYERLKTLDISATTTISSLKLPKNLKYLDLAESRVTSIDLSNVNLEHLDISGCESLRYTDELHHQLDRLESEKCKIVGRRKRLDNGVTMPGAAVAASGASAVSNTQSEVGRQ